MPTITNYKVEIDIYIWIDSCPTMTTERYLDDLVKANVLSFIGGKKPISDQFTIGVYVANWSGDAYTSKWKRYKITRLTAVSAWYSTLENGIWSPEKRKKILTREWDGGRQCLKIDSLHTITPASKLECKFTKDEWTKAQGNWGNVATDDFRDADDSSDEEW